MYNISDKAIAAIKSNNRLRAKLMIEFDRTSDTIDNWIQTRNVKLTTPRAVEIITEESGLLRDEIIEEQVSQTQS